MYWDLAFKGKTTTNTGSAGAKLATMYSKIKTTFFQSLIVMPLMVTNILAGVPVSATITPGEMNSTNSAVIIDERAEKIDQYFKSYNMPLAGYGQKMVEVADKNDIDWRLIPALAVIESTGGKFACKSVDFSAFGWGSCKIGFKSYDQAIESLGEHLGGNHPNTSRYYKGKDTKGKLARYNSVIPDYTAKITKVMEAIGKTEVKK